MSKFRVLAAVIIMLFSSFALAEEGITLSVCLLPDNVYQFSFTGNPDGWGFTNADSYDLETLQATGNGVMFTVWYDTGTISIFGYPDAPPCPPDGGTGQPDGGFITITKPVGELGNYLFQIQDDYGHWSDVAIVSAQQEGELLFVRLVLGKDNSIHDAERYRVFLQE